MKKNGGWKHPELREGEVLWKNSPRESLRDDISGWKSARVGNESFYVTGELIPPGDEVFPIFVREEELSQRGLRLDH